MTKQNFIERIKCGCGLSEELQDEITKEQLEKSIEEENYNHIPRID